MNLLDKCRKLISEGNISQALSLLEDEAPKTFKGDVILLKNRFKEYKSISRSNTHSDGDLEKRRNRIVSDIASVLLEIDAHDSKIVEYKNSNVNRVEDNLNTKKKNSYDLNFIGAIKFIVWYTLLFVIASFFVSKIVSYFNLNQYNELMKWATIGFLWVVSILSVDYLFYRISLYFKSDNSRSTSTVKFKKSYIYTLVIALLLSIIVVLIPVGDDRLASKIINYINYDKIEVREVLVEELNTARDIEVKAGCVRVLSNYIEKNTLKDLLSYMEANKKDLSDVKMSRVLASTLSQFNNDNEGYGILKEYFYSKKENYNQAQQYKAINDVLQEKYKDLRDENLLQYLSKSNVDSLLKEELTEKIKSIDQMLKSEISDFRKLAKNVKLEVSPLSIVLEAFIKMNVKDVNIQQSCREIADSNIFGQDIKLQALNVVSNFADPNDIDFFINRLSESKDPRVKTACLGSINKILSQ